MCINRHSQRHYRRFTGTLPGQDTYSQSSQLANTVVAIVRWSSLFCPDLPIPWHFGVTIYYLLVCLALCPPDNLTFATLFIETWEWPFFCRLWAKLPQLPKDKRSQEPRLTNQSFDYPVGRVWRTYKRYLFIWMERETGCSVQGAVFAVFICGIYLPPLVFALRICLPLSSWPAINQCWMLPPRSLFEFAPAADSSDVN